MWLKRFKFSQFLLSRIYCRYSVGKGREELVKQTKTKQNESSSISSSIGTYLALLSFSLFFLRPDLGNSPSCNSTTSSTPTSSAILSSSLFLCFLYNTQRDSSSFVPFPQTCEPLLLRPRSRHDTREKKEKKRSRNGLCVAFEFACNVGLCAILAATGTVVRSSIEETFSLFLLFFCSL